MRFFNVENSLDYYSFGMLMPERFGGGDYRYSFQGQEADNEVKGKGNSVNYKYRMHDARLGRFFAVDPLANEYPFYSPYQFSGNIPIRFVELEGLEPGEPFDSALEAGLNFAEIYGRMSILENREYAAYIYSYTDKNGDIKYAYNVPKRGSKKGSKPSLKMPKNSDIEIDVHTHGSYIKRMGKYSNIFSRRDIDIYKYSKNIGWVFTPGGFFLEFDPYKDYKDETEERTSRYTEKYDLSKIPRDGRDPYKVEGTTVVRNDNTKLKTVNKNNKLVRKKYTQEYKGRSKNSTESPIKKKNKNKKTTDRPKI